MNKTKSIKKPVLAICYDFDKTLSPTDMQAQGYIQKVYKSVDDFWDNNRFDDDVFSWFDKKEKKLIGHTGITYVSNIGTVATIHIKPRHNDPAYIAYIKDYFNLHDIYGITKVLIEEI